MRVLVCGSRHYQGPINSTLDEEFKELKKDKYKHVLINGGAKGADTLAREWAIKNEFPCLTYPADWRNLGKAAGPIRNKQMLDEGKPDLVIAFLAPDSRGTLNMISQASTARIPVKVISIDGESDA